MKFVLFCACAILLSYALCHLYLMCIQRQIVFRPQPGGESNPADFGVPFREITIPSADGSLQAWWLEHPDGGSRPTLLYCHGNAANLSLLAEVASIFYGYGWNALLFEYRGYGRSSAQATLSEESLVADAVNAGQWLLARHHRSRVVVWGHSLGSSIAARAALELRPAGLILEGAFTDLAAVARHRYPWAFIHSFMLWDKFDTAASLAARDYPLLLVHAAGDEVIPLELGRRAFAAAAQPKEFLLVPQIGHKDFPSVARDYAGQLQRQVSRWIEQASVPVK